MNDLAIIHLTVPAAVKAAWVLRSRMAGMKLTDWVVSNMEQISIENVVSEIGSGLIESPIYWKSKQTTEGVEAMIQASEAFDQALTDAQKADAALWIGEAYLIFSNSLPDAGENEKSTGWATANQIAKLLGGPQVWEQRVTRTYKTQ